MAPYEKPSKEIEKATTARKKALDDLKSKRAAYEVKLPAAQAAADRAAEGDSPAEFAKANAALREIDDGIQFFTGKIEKLEKTPVFKDPKQIRKEIENEQRKIEADAVAKLETLVKEAYEIAQDEFQKIMAGNRLKTETGADAMNWLSQDFYRADKLKGQRDALQRIVNNPFTQQK